MTHECTKAGEIEDIKNAVFGNGKPGLKENFIRMDENIKQLTESSQNLATAVSGLTKFMNETQGAIKEKKQLIGALYALSGLFIGSIVTLIIALIK